MPDTHELSNSGAHECLKRERKPRIGKIVSYEVLKKESKIGRVVSPDIKRE